MTSRHHTHPCALASHPQVRCPNTMQCTGLPVLDDCGAHCSAVTPDDERTVLCEDCEGLSLCDQCDAWLDEYPHTDDCPKRSPYGDDDDAADVAYEVWREQ